MKKLILIALVAVLACSCVNNDVNLTEGAYFWAKYGYSPTKFHLKGIDGDNYIAVTTYEGENNDGHLYVVFTKWDLQTDKYFKPLYPKKETTAKTNDKSPKQIDSTLAKLPVGAKFRMKVAGSVQTFVVVEKSKHELLVKDPRLTVDEWNMNIAYKNFNPDFYKRLR